MPEVTGAQFISQTENKLGLKIYTHQIKEAIKNITKIIIIKKITRRLICQFKLH